MIEITSEYLASQGLSETFPERFWSKVKITPTHWLWTGSTRFCSAHNPKGHGQIKMRTASNEKIYAHRAAWILCRGPIPEGALVLHRCPGGDVPCCVNPDHLELGDGFRNMQQMTEDGHNYFSNHKFVGETNPRAKLTDPQVIEIREKRATGNFTLKQLAIEYGVHLSCIHKVATLQSRT